MDGSTAAILPRLIATSCRPPMPAPGSSTSPPAINRSYRMPTPPRARGIITARDVVETDTKAYYAFTQYERSPQEDMTDGDRFRGLIPAADGRDPARGGFG
jgi:hypothetical protein